MADLILDGITKRFGSVVAVDDVSLKINHGEFLFVLGPSGCGKTTLLRTIAGFEHADDGKIFFGEKESTNIHPSNRNIGMVFQNYALFPHMTIYQNVEFGLNIRKVSDAEKHSRVMKALEMVRLDGLDQRYPRQLSGGQQQRAALARAIVIEPDILLLDEPFGALDRKLRVGMRLELRLLQKDLQITTVFVTHDQEEALTMSDRIAVMNGGHIEQIDMPVNIYERPATEFVADFIGAANLVTCRIDSVEPDVIKARITEGVDIRMRAVQGMMPGQEVKIIIRPEKIILRETSLPKYENALRGHIENILYLGDKTDYFVSVAGKTFLVSEQNLSADPMLYEIGKEVFMHFDCDSVLALGQ